MRRKSNSNVISGSAPTSSANLGFGAPATGATSAPLSFGTQPTTTSAPLFGATSTLTFGNSAVAAPAAASTMKPSLPTFGAAIQQQTNAPTASLSTGTSICSPFSPIHTQINRFFDITLQP